MNTEVIVQRLKPWIHGAPFRIHQFVNSLWAGLYRRRVQAILRVLHPPDTTRAEAAFDKLFAKAPPAPLYNYDCYAVWERGLKRTKHILELTQRRSGLRVLEVGCGDGITGWMLASYGHKVCLTDQQDWRDPRSSTLDFVEGPLEVGLPFEPASFDVIISYNTFEHLTDPERSWQELLRLCAPGGIVHLDFGPLFASAWGLHAYRTLPIPYAQFLFSEQFLEAKLRQLGVRDLGVERDTLQPMNQWTLERFQTLFDCGNGVVHRRDTAQLALFLPWILRFPESFGGRGLTVEDVITTHLVNTAYKLPSA